MPELPDVAVFKRYLDATSLHQLIEKVEIEDKAVLFEIGPRRFARRLKGHELVSSRRHGKYLFVETDGDDWLLLHFGMTGFLKYFAKEEHDPAHARVLLRFDHGYTLAYHSQRKLGRVSLVGSPEAFVESEGLGPDPLNSELGLEAFRRRVAGRSAAVKALLMNQEFLAGVGNVYSDEALFDAGIHPASPVSELDEGQVEALYHSLRKVLRAAIREHVDVDRFPHRSLLPHRQEGEPCPRCDGNIVKQSISGRSAYFCDRHQARNS